MSTINNEQDMGEAILHVLRASEKELSAKELEDQLTRLQKAKVDNFEMREAIWRLIADRLIVLTPKRTLKASR